MTHAPEEPEARSGESAGSTLFSRLIILGVTLAVGLAIAEIVLRIGWTNPYRAENVAMIVELHTPAKFSNRTVDRSPIDRENPIVTYRTNARGYIEPAARFNDPDFTVVFLGGSTTECEFVQEELRFPAMSSSLLEVRGMRVNALNFGVSGNDSHHSINNLLNYVVDDEPDVAIMMEAANNIGHLRATGGFQTAMGDSPSLATIGRLLFTQGSSRSSILGLVRHTKTLLAAKIQLDRTEAGGGKNDLRLDERVGDLPVEKFKQRLRAFIGICRAFDILPVLMTQPSDAFRNALTPDWLDQSDQALFNEMTREVAIAEGVDLIDLVGFLQAKESAEGGFRESVFYDGIHVTDFGSRLYAEHISERLRAILENH